MRERLNPTTIIVALITALSAVVTVAYNLLHDTRSEPCTIASTWIGDETPNPGVGVAPADRIRLAAAMVNKALECVK